MVVGSFVFLLHFWLVACFAVELQELTAVAIELQELTAVELAIAAQLVAAVATYPGEPAC